MRVDRRILVGLLALAVLIFAEAWVEGVGLVTYAEGAIEEDVDSGAATRYYVIVDDALLLYPGVEVIPVNAFAGLASFRKAVLPDGVTAIEAGAFANSGLEEINLPDSVTFIDDNAFQGVTGLRIRAATGSYGDEWAKARGYEVDAIFCLELPKALKAVEEEAFYGDTTLDRVMLPEGLETIEARAFANSGLTEINLPGSIRHIDDTAFDDLGWISFSAEADSYAYEWIYNRRYIPVPVSDISLDTTEAVLDEGGVLALKARVLPENAINPAVAWETSDASVAVVDAYGCVTAVGSGIAEITAHAVDGGSAGAVCRITVPKADGNIISNGVLVRYDGPGGDVSVPGTDSQGRPVTAIGDGAFRGHAGITSVTLPASVTEIGNAAFADCTTLERVNLTGSSLTRIGDGAFVNCPELTGISDPAVDMPSTEASYFDLDRNALVVFSDMCSEGGEILVLLMKPDRDGEDILGENLIYVNQYAADADGCLQALLPTPEQESCDVLLGGSFVDGVASPRFVGRAVRDKRVLALPPTLGAVSAHAFRGCACTHVYLDDGVAQIGVQAFADSSSLVYVDIPESVEQIDDTAFEGSAGVVIGCVMDSSAHLFAIEHDIPCVLHKK